MTAKAQTQKPDTQKSTLSATKDTPAAKGTQAAMKGIEADETSMDKDSATMSRIDKIKKAISDGDAKTLSSELSAASVKELKEIATSKKTVEQIFKMNDAISRNGALDRIYDGMTDVELLKDAIYVRFGVPVGSSKCSEEDAKSVDRISGIRDKEKPWTLNGAIHVYKVYLRLPQADLDQIRCLLTFGTDTTPGGAAWRSGNKTTGVYHVDYKESGLDWTEGGKGNPYTHIESNAKKKYGTDDTRKGMVMMDLTIAHELGHIIDFSQSKPYSSRQDFRAINQWKEYPLGNKKAIFDAIKAAMVTPFAGEMTAEEQRVADLCGKKALEEGASSPTELGAVVSQVVEDEYVEPKPEKETENKEEKKSGILAFFVNLFQQLFNRKSKTDNVGGRTKEALVKMLAQSDALKHIPRAWASQSPWYKGELFDGMTRQIHQGYENDSFFSFENEAWTRGKISKYQFRDPKEDFAETYATFFVANPIGSKTPAAHKQWFIAQGLDKAALDGQNVGTGGIHEKRA